MDMAKKMKKTKNIERPQSTMLLYDDSVAPVRFDGNKSSS